MLLLSGNLKGQKKKVSVSLTESLILKFSFNKEVQGTEKFGPRLVNVSLIQIPNYGEYTVQFYKVKISYHFKKILKATFFIRTSILNPC